MLDHIRNEENRKDAHVKPVDTILENKIRKVIGNCLRQHKERHEEIPTDGRHGTISEIIDDSNNGRPCTRRWSRKLRRVS